jgi:hypothetical protein
MPPNRTRQSLLWGNLAGSVMSAQRPISVQQRLVQSVERSTLRRQEQPFLEAMRPSPPASSQIAVSRAKEQGNLCWVCVARLIPFIVLLYIVNFIHRTNVATVGEAKGFIDRRMA